MKTQKKIMLLFCAYVILSSLLSGHTSKMNVLLQCVTVLISYDKYYAATKIDKRKMIVYATLGVVLMFFSFSFANKQRGQYDADKGLEYYTSAGHIQWEYNSSFFMPYMYLSTPWTNLEYITRTQDERTNGLWTLKPILGYVGLAKDYEKEYELKPYSNFNTFTYIATGFKDFGFWLSIIASLLLGFYVKKIYSRYLVSKSPFDITSYILVALATIEMFFSNHFFMQSYPFTCFLVMELWKFIMSGFSTKIELEELEELEEVEND